MNLPFPSPFPAVVTPETWATWEGKSADAIHQRIKRKQIPPHCILYPTERVILIDVNAYLEHLRDKRKAELASPAEPVTDQAAGGME